MKTLKSCGVLLLATMTILSAGCGRAILVQPGTTAALARQVKTDIYVADDKGTLVKKSATLPEGTLIHTQAVPSQPTPPVNPAK